jgi:hypothetical protein
MLPALILGIFIVVILLRVGRFRRSTDWPLRTIPGYDMARRAVARSAEAGHPLHLSPGPGAVGESGVGTAETLAGLNMVSALGSQAALTGATLAATTADATTLALVENVVRQDYAAAGRLDEAPLVGAIRTRTVEGHAQGVRMLAHRDRLAYVAAATDLIENEGAMYSLASGGFGPEYLRLGEAQARAGVPAVAGATDPQALATMMVSTEHTLIGEEIFAAGAYLGRYAAHLASLQAQDLVRWLVIALIIIGVILASVLGTDQLAGLLALVR